MQAPIGPATTTDLVVAVVEAGGLGCLAASWTFPSVLRAQVREIQRSIDRPFCVNLVLAFDQQERIDLLGEERVPVISFSWGIDDFAIKRARAAGARVLVQVGDVETGERAAAAGADILIAQGVEAGGHVQSGRRYIGSCTIYVRRCHFRSSPQAGSQRAPRWWLRSMRAPRVLWQEPPTLPPTRPMCTRCIATSCSAPEPPRRHSRRSSMSAAGRAASRSAKHNHEGMAGCRLSTSWAATGRGSAGGHTIASHDRPLQRRATHERHQRRHRGDGAVRGNRRRTRAATGSGRSHHGTASHRSIRTKSLSAPGDAEHVTQPT